MTSPHRITWKHEGGHGRPFTLARHRMVPSQGIGLHDHGFDECFWVEAGGGAHCTAAGEVALAPGDAVGVRAADAHGFRVGADGLVLVNVSFPRRTTAALGRGRAEWPWRAGGPVRQRRLDAAAMERLHGWTAELSQPGAGAADLDAFLLDFARLLRRPPERLGLPPHLRAACQAFASEAAMPGGTAELARLVGCGPAHLNRLCRRWHGCTASELVARLRLDWAERELRLTARPVAELAAASGMPHLGHFYRRFRGRFGTTPKAWRDASWGLFAPTSAAPPTSSP